ncbi:MAG: aldehyde dehydrogenase family protein, partial [Pseudonocardiaceae bacterium]
MPEELSEPARVFAAGPHHHLIGGAKVASADGRTFTTVDPSTGLPIADVPQGGPEDVDRAVSAARSAFQGAWGSMPAPKRERLLLELARLLEEHAGELAELEALDNGKPVTFARAVDVAATAGHLR